MIIDARGLSYMDTFKQVKDAVFICRPKFEDLMIFVESHQYEKYSLIKGFIEILLECETTMEETAGYYVIRINMEHTAAVN
jgi:hypothetical protein